jgi:DNA-binding XRE family transcriptional regulator
MTGDKSKTLKVDTRVHDFLLLAAQIRAARALLGWSQGYLAEGIGMNRPTIVNIEANKREPRPATLSVLKKN